MVRLSQSQLEAWRRTRRKGMKRIAVEQFLAWSVVGLGGPTVRAFLRGGSRSVSGFWSGVAAVEHLAVGLCVGLAGALIFGVLSWKRMERSYTEATATGGDSLAEGHRLG